MIKAKECLISFGAEYFVFQFAFQKHKFIITRNIILLVVLCGCDSWYFTFRQQ
jgi:hypothetical protein